MTRILVTTVPFGTRDPTPLEQMKERGLEYVINPLNKKLTEEELIELIPEFDVLIAGTEPITERVLERAKRLKFISRVGIGLDSVDLTAARRLGMRVSYTPDAPAAAVAELSVGLMLSLLRGIHLSNADLHQKIWHRHFGRRLGEVTVGLIGLGRVGSRVLEHLRGFDCPKILCNDIQPNLKLGEGLPIEWVEKETIYDRADLISLHVPLTPNTRDLISLAELEAMKSDALLLNTSRGGIIHEADLHQALTQNKIGGAAMDVFEQEPYSGPLSELQNCLMTAHMGSMSVDCRTRMEIEATQEALRFIGDEPLIGEVPEMEYELQLGMKLS